MSDHRGRQGIAPDPTANTCVADSARLILLAQEPEPRESIMRQAGFSNVRSFVRRADFSKLTRFFAEFIVHGRVE